LVFEEGTRMNEPNISIAPEDRTLAALTHLSGLSGYIVPLGGILVPILIWATKKDTPVIASIAKQAILLNLSVFLLVCAGVVLFFTVILIPAVILAWVALGIGAIALPIIGAIRANDGRYYKYPVVGVTPDNVSATTTI
jgi:uncharacterized Tic20 family protein